MADLTDYLYSNINWLDIDPNVLDLNLQKAIINPFQYIVSCIALPFSIPVDQLEMVDELKFGFWNVPVAGFRFTDEDTFAANEFAAFGTSFGIPKHSAASRGDWVLTAPYSYYTLIYPPFGELPIDATLIRSCTALYAGVTVDCKTGAATLQLEGLADGAAPVILGRYHANVGAPVQLAQMSGNFAAQIAGGTSSPGIVTAAIAAGRAIMSDITGISSIPGPGSRIQTTGVDGSLVDVVAGAPTLLFEHFNIAEEANDELGRPYCNTQLIVLMDPGYLQLLDGDIAAPATAPELTQIKQYLEGGFFYE